MHPVSIAGVILAIPLGIWLNGWLKTVLGGIAGFGIMLALYYFGELFRRAIARAKTTRRRDSVGLWRCQSQRRAWIDARLAARDCQLIFAILLGGIAAGILFMLIRKYQAFNPYLTRHLLIAAVSVLFSVMFLNQ